MTPSVRVRLGRNRLRETMKRQVRDRVSREAAPDERSLGRGRRGEFDETGLADVADPDILTKS